MDCDSSPLDLRRTLLESNQGIAEPTNQVGVQEPKIVLHDPLVAVEPKTSSLSIRPDNVCTSEYAPQATVSRRPREDDEAYDNTSGQVQKRLRTSTLPTRPKSLKEATVEYWVDFSVWPTAEQEQAMDPIAAFRHCLATPRSMESSNSSLTSQTTTGLNTIFSEERFEKHLGNIRGQTAMRVFRDISLLIVPSAEILAVDGDKHLEFLKETNCDAWINSYPLHDLQPRPCYGLGFEPRAFTKEQRGKLEPFIGNLLEDWSHFAATCNMYFPFLTCEIKGQEASLDVADRQNTHSQTVALKGLFQLFEMVGREKDLHREVCGFSISHNDEGVRIWGHYIVINDRTPTFYRCSIDQFIINKDTRSLAYKFVRNIYDIWVPDHFKKISSAIDMIPADIGLRIAEAESLISRSSHAGVPQPHEVDEYQRTVEQH
ncbi:hypothetical protein BU24DRAFT_451576 [Aaosphaeria arxii CBS 175.79]|uniref:DUF7924 domain-containing protein n=1 Tax=Aaosphaeria arxii CBS 175.79 TaxID=1450172 RepID=A0A6A5XQK3_9PLEO|nr:uncharacterized protein BU24DRAFT_451576 [Aaosphaeria arxii CBS 175.79]KAF2014574.1 hypothetical protein BU24DRAFT_451576 [Aaosphaeria arxii CBS 175.79]